VWHSIAWHRTAESRRSHLLEARRLVALERTLGVWSEASDGHRVIDRKVGVESALIRGLLTIATPGLLGLASLEVREVLRTRDALLALCSDLVLILQ
jgi:hypothetical protein